MPPCHESAEEVLKKCESYIRRSLPFPDRDDLYQEVCLAVLKQSSERAITKALVMAIAENKRRDMFRRHRKRPIPAKHRSSWLGDKRTNISRRKRQHPPLELQNECCSNDLDPLSTLERAECRDLVKDRIAELSAKNKDAVEARTYSDHSDNENARERGIPVETFRTRYKAGLEKLRPYVMNLL